MLERNRGIPCLPVQKASQSSQAVHTKEELELIHRMRRRNPNPGLTELWYRLKQKGYSRTVESLYRCMRREGLIKPSMAQKKALAKPYQKIARKGIKIECVQTDNGFEFTNRFFYRVVYG